MAGDPNFFSLAPSIVTIALALITRRVLPSLFIGIVVGFAIISFPHVERAPFQALERMVSVSAQPGNLVIIAFSLAIGGLLALIRAGGGFTAFADAVEKARAGFGRKTAFGATFLISLSMFLESWSNILVNAATNAPLYDRLRISRMRLAYFVHTLAVCIVSMAALNGWGAYYMGLLSAQDIENPLAFIISAIPFMLYNWASLGVVALTMATGLSLGTMARFEALAARGEEPLARGGEGERDATLAMAEGVTPRLVFMAGPLLVLIASVFIALYATGGGDIIKGAGGLSILYAVAAASFSAGLLLIAYRAYRPLEVEQRYVAGMARFFDIALLIVLALTVGDLTRELGAGLYLAGLVGDTLPAFAVPALVFILGAIISFATGTSYGTFAILTPIAMPLAISFGVNPALVFGAVISGGLFGDNASPISDSTILSALGAEVELIDHVRTQLPYALMSAAMAMLGFLILGLFM